MLCTPGKSYNVLLSSKAEYREGGETPNRNAPLSMSHLNVNITKSHLTNSLILTTCIASPHLLSKSYCYCTTQGKYRHFNSPCDLTYTRWQAICKQNNLDGKSNGKEYDKSSLLYKQEWNGQYGRVMKLQRYGDYSQKFLWTQINADLLRLWRSKCTSFSIFTFSFFLTYLKVGQLFSIKPTRGDMRGPSTVCKTWTVLAELRGITQRPHVYE